jgi:hypothetical protein
VPSLRSGLKPTSRCGSNASGRRPGSRVEYSRKRRRCSVALEAACGQHRRDLVPVGDLDHRLVPEVVVDVALAVALHGS